MIATVIAFAILSMIVIHYHACKHQARTAQTRALHTALIVTGARQTGRRSR